MKDLAGRALSQRSNHAKTAASILPQSVQATHAKNRFGEILKNARSRGPVFIERHGQTQAVVLDITTYTALVEAKRSPDEKRLDELRGEFDALYASMQKPAVRKIADRFLAASAEELNEAARRAKPRG